MDTLCINTLKNAFEYKKWVTSIQLDPFRDPRRGLTAIQDFLALLRGLPIKFADINTSAKGVKQDSLHMACGVERLGFHAVPHISPRDSLADSVLSQVCGAYTWGNIRSVLVISGDPRDGNVGPKMRGVYETDSAGIIACLNGLRLERGMTDLLIGCAFSQDYYGGIYNHSELIKFAKKRAAGADFVMTQPMFYHKNRAYELQCIAENISLPMIVGLWPFFDEATPAKIRRGEIPGVLLPDDTFSALEKYKGNIAMQAEWCAEITKELKAANIAGVYIVTPFRHTKHREFVDFLWLIHEKGGIL